MTHATEGLLVAYVDGEIDGAAAAELDGHLAACDQCARELQEMRRLSVRTHESLSLLDAPAPLLRARAAVGAERARVEPRRSTGWSLTRLGARGLARAAMLLLALAGAAAAAVPGSPVRRALETTIARVSQLLNGEPSAPAVPVAPVVEPAAPVVEPAAPAYTERSSMAILPASGRVRVVLHAPAGPLDVTVRLVPASRALVETASAEADVRMRSAAGRIEVMGLGAGEVRIDVPATVPNATVEIGGMVYVYKAGDVLQLSGPAGTGRGGEVRFRVER
jgi:hypothetical protein